MVDQTYLTLLQQLIRIPSVTQTDGEGELAQWLKDYLREKGVRATLQPVSKAGDRFNVVAQKHFSRGKTLWLTSHLDTVPPEEGWKKPFQPRWVGKWLHGLGAADMKAGLAIHVEAFIEAQRQSVNGSIGLAILCDEENEDAGAYAFCEKYVRKDDAALFSEPTLFSTKPALVDSAYGRYAFDVTVRTEAQHGAFAKHDALATAWKKMNAAVKKLNAGGDRVTLASIRADGYGYTNPGMIRARIHYAFKKTKTVEEAKKKVSKVFGRDVAIASRSTPYLKPWRTPSQHALVKSAQSAMRENNLSAKLSCSSSTFDANVFAKKKVACVNVGPVGKNIHSSQEAVDVTSLDLVWRVMRKVIYFGTAGGHTPPSVSRSSGLPPVARKPVALATG